MPTDYELMEAYRSWWRDNFSMSPNSQAVIHAAAWAKHVLATYQAGLDVPTAEPIDLMAECRILDPARWERLNQTSQLTAEPTK